MQASEFKISTMRSEVKADKVEYVSEPVGPQHVAKQWAEQF